MRVSERARRSECFVVRPRTTTAIMRTLTQSSQRSTNYAITPRSRAGGADLDISCPRVRQRPPAADVFASARRSSASVTDSTSVVSRPRQPSNRRLATSAICSRRSCTVSSSSAFETRVSMSSISSSRYDQRRTETQTVIRHRSADHAVFLEQLGQPPAHFRLRVEIGVARPCRRRVRPRRSGRCRALRRPADDRQTAGAVRVCIYGPTEPTWAPISISS